jgi:hypothetical protein
MTYARLEQLGRTEASDAIVNGCRGNFDNGKLR